MGTPLCVVRTDPETKKKDTIYLGKVTSLEINHKVKDVVRKADVGGGVAVKIEHAAYQSAKQYGRHCTFPFLGHPNFTRKADPGSRTQSTTRTRFFRRSRAHPSTFSRSTSETMFPRRIGC